MGYDCTLHVVDAKSLEHFVDQFLGRAPAGHDTRFDEVRAAIAEDPRAGGKRLLHELLFFVSRQAPHAPSRGFALGLWDRFVDEELPAVFCRGDALLTPLADIVRAHPELRSELYTGIIGNYEVGDYVPADQVPALLDFVEHAVERHSRPSDHRAFIPLLQVLRVAKAKKMAYWEATDLPVAQCHADWLAAAKEQEPKRVGKIIEVPLRLARPIGLARDHLVVTAVSPQGTCAIDVSRDPPTAGAVDESFIWQADVSSSGRIFGKVAGPGPNVLAEIDPVSATNRVLALPEGRYIDALRLVGERVLIAPPLSFGAKGETPAWYDIETGMLSTLELPEPEGGWELPRHRHSHGSSPGWSVGVFDAFDLGDHGVLVVWGGWLFRLLGEEVTRLPLSGLRLATVGGPQGIVESDLVICVDNGVLVRIGVDGSRGVFSPSIDGVLELRPGPGDAMVIKQLDNPEGDMLKVIWRDDRELTRITGKQLGSKDLPAAMVYLEKRDELALFFYTEEGDTVIRLLPWSDIVAMPRSTFAEVEQARADVTS